MRFYRLFVLILVLFLGVNVKAEVRGTFASESGADQEIEVEEVQVRLMANNPVVLLRVGEKAIPIFVDPTVAGSIQGALSGEKFPRPLSHDLMHRILGAYHVKVERVFITLREGVFYGTLTLSQNGQLQLFDSRSSDAIALAIHSSSPILIQKSLLETAGKLLEGPESQQGLEL